MKTPKQSRWALITLLAWLAATPAAHTFYNPSMGRWLNRDPLGELSFQRLTAKRSGRIRPDEGNLYRFVRNDPISNSDYLGLWVVCCRAGDPDPDDGYLVGIILPYIRHCEIQETACPDSKWTSYPITVSPTGKMDNGKCCSSVTAADIAACLKRHPYSAGEGLPGNNCQTSVIKSLAKCCLKSTWDPNWYAGDTRGERLEWKTIWVRDGEGGMKQKDVCIRWVPFPIFQQCSNTRAK
jgi:RHS repeat-associated protein